MPVGAGAAKARPPKPPLSSPGSSPALQLRGRNVASQEASSVQESTHGAWAPQTVEIQGADGEVLGLRPCGEVLALKPKDTARMAMPSLEEVLLPREVKTVRPMAKRRSESKELRPGTPKDRHSAEAAVASEASIPSTGETNQEKQLPEALAAAVAHLMDVANCVAAAARKTDPTPDSDGHAPKPTKPPMSPSSRASQGKLRPWSKANGSARSIEAELRTPDRLAARRSRSAVPGEKALRGPTEDVPGRSPGRVSRVKSSSESPGACNRSKLMGKYADLDHVLLLPPDAIHWSSSAVEDPSPSAASAASASASPQSKDELKTVLASALSSQRTLRLEADPCTVPVQGAASELTLATRLAQLSPEQRLALQELLDVAEKAGLEHDHIGLEALVGLGMFGSVGVSATM